MTLWIIYVDLPWGFIKYYLLIKYINNLVYCNYISHCILIYYTTGIRNVSAWSQRMRLPMEEVYGKEYFSKLLSAWVDAMLDIGQRNGGDICKSCVSKITAPTLVIQGDKDPMVPFEHAKYLSENISKAK